MTDRRTAIVTGSTSGIGLGVAEALAAAGLDVMLNGFGEPADIAAARERVGAAGPGAVGHHGADMADPAQIEDLVTQTRDAFGSVDVVVANAGIQVISPIEELDPEKLEALFRITLFSAFHLARLTFAGMKHRGWGRVICVASAHGLVASPFKAPYVAAKHGMVGLAKTLALEGAEHGITANAICPGYVLTPLVEGQIPDTAKARGMTEAAVKRDVLLAAQPTREFVRADQIGALAAFLCSEAAAQITGAALPVDGGWTAQ